MSNFGDSFIYVVGVFTLLLLVLFGLMRAASWLALEGRRLWIHTQCTLRRLERQRLLDDLEPDRDEREAEYR